MTYTDVHTADHEPQAVEVQQQVPQVNDVVSDYNDDNNDTSENGNTEFLDITVQAPASEIEQTMATVAMAEDSLQAIMDDVSRLWQGIIHTVNDDDVDGDGGIEMNTVQSTTTAHHADDVMMTGDGGIPHSMSTLHLVGPQTDVPYGELVMQQQQQQQQQGDDYEFVVIDVDGSGDEQHIVHEEDKDAEAVAVESGDDVQVELETSDFSVSSENQVHEETGDGTDGVAFFSMAMEEYAQENMLDPSVDSGMVLDDIVQDATPVERHYGPSDSIVQDVSAALVPSHMTDPTDGISVITMTTLDEVEGTEIGEAIASTDCSGGKFGSSEPGELSIRATADNGDKLESIAPKQRTFTAAKALFVVVIGFAMALASHIASGTQPVFSSYMQNTAKVPPLSLNFIASTSMLVTIFLPVKIVMTLFGCLKRQIKSRKIQRQYSSTQPSAFSSMARLFKQVQSIRPLRALRFLRNNSHLVRQLVSRIALTGFVLALFALLLILRSVSILFGARFAQPTYVALVRLLEPFFTTVLGVTVAFAQSTLAKQKTRRKYQEQQNHPVTKNRKKKKFSFPIFPILITLWLAVAFVGGALIVVGMTSRSENGDFTWHLDVKSLTEKFTTLDAVGVGLSLCSVLLQSIYNIFIMFLMAPPKPTTTQSGSPSVSPDLMDLEAQNPVQGQLAPVQRKTSRGRTVRFSGFDLVLIQFIVYSCGFLFLGGVTGEITQWDQWLQLSVMDYLIGFLYAFLVFFAVDILYAYASKLISSQNVASIMATSLLSTMCLSWIISGEPISNLWMIVGAALVVVAITFFITTRRIAANRSLKRAMAKSSAETEIMGHVPEIQHTSTSAHEHEFGKFVDVELSMNQAAATAGVDILDDIKHPEPDSDMVRDISDESLFEKPTVESATTEHSPNVASEIHDAISAAVAVLESTDDHV